MQILITLFLLPFTFSPSYSKTIPLPEALDRGLVSLEITGLGGHTGKSLKVRAENLHKKNWTLHIPAGFIFHSQDTSIQDLVVIRSRDVEMEKGAGGFARLYGMCIQAGNGSPGEGESFFAGGLASGDLAKLVDFIDEKRIIDEPAQYAIWAVTDGKGLGNIRNKELQLFTAELLGKLPPGYVVVRDRLAPAPGHPAFYSKPAIVEGVFRYKTTKDIQASFGLYDQEGELLHAFFRDQPQRAGGHRFKFYFEVRNLSKGIYYARLTTSRGTVEEMKIELD